MTISFPLVLMDADSYIAGMHCVVGARNFFANQKISSRFGLLSHLMSLRETIQTTFSDEDKLSMSSEVQCIYLDMALRGVVPSAQTSCVLPGWHLFVTFVSHTHPDQLTQSFDARLLAHEDDLSQNLGQVIGHESFPRYGTNIAWIYRYLCDQCVAARKKIHADDRSRQSRFFLSLYGVNPWIDHWKQLPSYGQFLNRFIQLPVYASVISGVKHSQPWRHRHRGIRLAQAVAWQPRILKVLWFACAGVVFVYTSWIVILGMGLFLSLLLFAHRITLGMLTMEANRWRWHTSPHQFLSRRVKLLYMIEHAHDRCELDRLRRHESVMMQGLSPFFVHLSDEMMLISMREYDQFLFKKLVRSYCCLGLWGIWSYRSSRLHVLQTLLRDGGVGVCDKDLEESFKQEEEDIKKRFWSWIWCMGCDAFDHG